MRPVQTDLFLSQWMTGVDQEADGPCYTHLIRSKDDPLRDPRTKGRDRAPHLTIGRCYTIERAAKELLEHLADGQPRTFNRIGLEMFGLTADVLFTTPINDALWLLVKQSQLEHTTEAPVLFRRRKP